MNLILSYSQRSDALRATMQCYHLVLTRLELLGHLNSSFENCPSQTCKDMVKLLEETEVTINDQEKCSAAHPRS